MKRLAIIPARGGSKRIPGKNIKDFLGKPIIAYSIETAAASGLFDEIMVSTDDEAIADTARRYGAVVPFMRSAEASDDFATTADVLREVLSKYAGQGHDIEEACCIYATAPLMNGERLVEALAEMHAGGYDCAFPVVQFSYPPQRGLVIRNGKVSRNDPKHAMTRSQDLEPIYHDAGQFYFFKVDSFAARNTLISTNSCAIVLPELEVQDLDNLTDWALAEMKYKLMYRNDE